MSTLAHPAPLQPKPAAGFIPALVLHIAIAAAFLAAAFLHPTHRENWGDKSATQGAVRASMVSAIPLPHIAPPVEKQVLAEEHESPAPTPPPPARTEPPPTPKDVLVKSKEAPRAVTKPGPATPDPPKHPQPTPDTPKAATGASATQLAMASVDVKNGTAVIDIPDRQFGARYAYYQQIMKRAIAQNWFTAEADPRASQGKKALVEIEIEADGSIGKVRLTSKSGSPSLDTSALHALQRIDTFGPLPAGDHVTVQLTFDYHQP